MKWNWKMLQWSYIQEREREREREIRERESFNSVFIVCNYLTLYHYNVKIVILTKISQIKDYIMSSVVNKNPHVFVDSHNEF